MNTEISTAILITGASSGIGRATAVRLAGRGWTVYAGARNPARIQDLQEDGCRPIALDVTEEASMRHAVARVGREAGGVGALINNAGYSQSGAIETVPMDLVRRQFETNLFGLVTLTELVLPGMRRQRWGKVVNLSSIGGRLTWPGGGYYHATKYAVEAITEVLRFEVRGFGVDAILIEPGLIRSNFGDAAARTVDELPSDRQMVRSRSEVLVSRLLSYPRLRACLENRAVDPDLPSDVIEQTARVHL